MSWSGTLARPVPAPVWRTLDRITGAAGQEWPYCVVALHRVWDGSRDELSLAPTQFRELCRYWRDHYEILNLDQLLARLAARDPGRGPTLAITFDDGYADNFEIAAPILDDFGLSATFFVATGVIGTDHRFPWDAGLSRAPRLMTWDEVRSLRGAGFGIGSHTVSHARLAAVRGAELAHELEESRRRLARELGEPVEDLAYPFGGPSDCDDAARTAVRRAGYRSCFSCHGGGIQPLDSPFALRRIAVSPVHHATPKAWARAYSRMRWRAAAHAEAA